MLWIYAISSVSVVSVISLCGVIAIPVKRQTLDKVLFYLLALGTGAMIGNGAFHLLPESLEHASSTMAACTLILAGFLFCFLMEKVLKLRCHHSADGHCRADHDEHSSTPGSHIHATGWMSLISHGMDNFMDGALIGVAFLQGIPLGIATTTAIVLHEIPMEFGGFGILVNAGFSKRGAILVNFCSALVATAATALTLWFGESVQGLNTIMTPIACGMVFYIAIIGLIPQLLKGTTPRRFVIQFSIVLVGITAMILVKLMEP